MIDDRNETASSREITDICIRESAHNVEAWSRYLGEPEADGDAAPSRVADLPGLPPCFIGVGELDLFRNETREFVPHQTLAGVLCKLHMIPQCSHAMEVFAPEARTSKEFCHLRFNALNRALHGA